MEQPREQQREKYYEKCLESSTDIETEEEATIIKEYYEFMNKEEIKDEK